MTRKQSSKKHEQKSVAPVADEKKSAVQTNLDAVKMELLKHCVDSELKKKIDEGDVYFIMNRCLCNNAQRNEVAGWLGLDSCRCAICAKNEFKREECASYSMPLNNCRNRIIEWLQQERKEK